MRNLSRSFFLVITAFLALAIPTSYIGSVVPVAHAQSGEGGAGWPGRVGWGPDSAVLGCPAGAIG